MIGALPEYLAVGRKEYKIRSDYRNVLQVFEAFSDPELEHGEKWIVAIYLLMEPFVCADDVYAAADSGFDINEAVSRIIWFISAGQNMGDKKEQPTYDWAQDEQIIFSAINKISGKEIRGMEYLHWWTFLGYFNEVGESSLTFIIGIRSKLNKKKKLEKHEREFLNNNPGMVRLEKRKTAEELEQEAKYKALWNEVLG